MDKIYHGGKEYESFGALCRAYGMNTSTVSFRLKKGMSLEDALRYKNITKRYVVTYKGKTYNSAKELADAYQVEYRVLREELKKNISTEKALRNAQLRTSGGYSLWGKYYPSAGELSKAFGFSSYSFLTQLRNNPDWTTEQLVKSLLEKQITYNNKTFENLTALAAAYSFQVGTIQRRLQLGWSLDDALATPVKGTTRNANIHYRGINYNSFSALCTAYNINVTMILGFLRCNQEKYPKLTKLSYFDLLVKFLEKVKLPLDNQLLTKIPRVLYDGTIYYSYGKYALSIGLSKRTWDNLVNKNPTLNAPQLSMVALTSTTKGFIYQGKRYKWVEIESLLGMKLEVLLKKGIVQREDFPKYPNCTYNPSVECIDIGYIYQEYFDNELPKYK